MKLRYKILFIAVALIGLSSCKDFLDKVPDTRVYLVNLDQLQQLPGHPFPFRLADPVAPGIKVQVFPAFQAVIHAEEVRHIAHQFPGLLPVLHHVRIVYISGSGSRLHQGGKDPHGGGFSGAVGSDKAVQGTVRYFQAQVPQGGKAAIVLAKVINFQHFPASLPD